MHTVVECEIVLTANCEFLCKIQLKESHEKEYTIIIHDHIPFTHACVFSIAYVHVFLISHIFDLLAHCMHVPIAVDRRG